MIDKKLTRRKFVRRCFRTAATALAFGIPAVGCRSKKPDKTEREDISVESCGDLSGVSKEELKKREAAGYVEETPFPSSRCENCRLYIPPGSGENCGECAVFSGPVYESGYCDYWEPAG